MNSAEDAEAVDPDEKMDVGLEGEGVEGGFREGGIAGTAEGEIRIAVGSGHRDHLQRWGALEGGDATRIREVRPAGPGKQVVPHAHRRSAKWVPGVAAELVSKAGHQVVQVVVDRVAGAAGTILGEGRVHDPDGTPAVTRVGVILHGDRVAIHTGFVLGEGAPIDVDVGVLDLDGTSRGGG